MNTSNEEVSVLVTKEGYVRNLRCELVSGEDVSHLEGKIKTIIDGLGLPEKQEKAVKDIVQTTLWEWFNFITGHNTDHLIDKKEWYNSNK